MWICAKTDNILYFCIKFLLRGCLKTNVKAGEWMRRSILNHRKTEIKCIKKKNCVTLSRMDAFLAPLSLIFSHSATALLLQIMNRLAQKIHPLRLHFCY